MELQNLLGLHAAGKGVSRGRFQNSRIRSLLVFVAQRVRAATLRARFATLVGTQVAQHTLEVRSSRLTRWPFRDKPFMDLVGWLCVELTKNAA